MKDLIVAAAAIDMARMSVAAFVLGAIVGSLLVSALFWLFA